MSFDLNAINRMRSEMDTIAPDVTHDDRPEDRPEWADRMLPIRDVRRIVNEHPSTIYRKIEAGIYPKMVHLQGSSRMPGWELWRRLKRLVG